MRFVLNTDKRSVYEKVQSYPFIRLVRKNAAVCNLVEHGNLTRVLLTQQQEKNAIHCTCPAACHTNFETKCRCLQVTGSAFDNNCQFGKVTSVDIFIVQELLY